MSSALAKAAGRKTETGFALRKRHNQQRTLLAPFLHVLKALLASPTAPGLLSLYPFPWAGSCRPCFYECEDNISTIESIIETYSTDRFLLTVHVCAGALLGLLIEIVL